MAVSHVQFTNTIDESFASNPTTITLTLGSAPTAGNVLLMMVGNYNQTPYLWETPEGFTKLDDTYSTLIGSSSSERENAPIGMQFYYRVVESGDSSSHTATFKAQTYVWGALVEVSGSGIPVIRSVPLVDGTTAMYFSDQGTSQSSSYTLLAAYDDTNTSLTNPTGFTSLLNRSGSSQSMYVGYDIGTTTIPDLNVSSGGYANLHGMAIEFPEEGTDVEPWDGASVVTVKPAGGGDYTTFSAAVADADLRNCIYRVEYAENTAFSSDTTVTQTSNTRGLADFNHYIHITAAEANRHSGVTGTGHARVDTYTPFSVDSTCDFVRISHLELLGDYSSVYVYGGDNVLLDNLILNEHGTTGYEGVRVNGGELLSVYNCVYLNNSSSYQKKAMDWPDNLGTTVFIGHCSFNGYVDCNAYPVNFFVYNSWFQSLSNYPIFEDGGRDQGYVRGSNNVYDSSLGLVDTGGASSGFDDFTHDNERVTGTPGLTTTTTGTDAIIITNVTSGSENLTPVAATGSGVNPILGTGTNVVPAFDTRIDLTLDVAGNPRPTTNIDIGEAYQISAGDSGTLPIKVWDGSAWVNVNSIQYYDGTWK